MDIDYLPRICSWTNPSENRLDGPPYLAKGYYWLDMQYDVVKYVKTILIQKVSGKSELVTFGLYYLTIYGYIYHSRKIKHIIILGTTGPLLTAFFFFFFLMVSQRRGRYKKNTEIKHSIFETITSMVTI